MQERLNGGASVLQPALDGCLVACCFLYKVLNERQRLTDTARPCSCRVFRSFLISSLRPYPFKFVPDSGTQ
jgi:hypothetical protein